MRILSAALRLAVAATASLSPICKAGAQTTNGRSTGTLATKHRYESIRAVRELTNGSAVLLEGRGTSSRALLLDSELRETGLSLGRRGSGPGEFTTVQALVPLAGDTTVLVDRSSRRWLYFHGTRFVRELARTGTAPQIIGRPAGADGRGRVLGVVALPFRASDPRPRPSSLEPSSSDSVAFVTVDPGSGAVDTVGYGKGGYIGAERIFTVRGHDGSSITHIRSGLFVTYDQAWLFPDGAIAIVSREPFAARWVSGVARTPNTQRIPLPYRVTPLTASEKVYQIEQHFWGAASAPSPADIPNWPTSVPPIFADALAPAPDGSLLVRHAPTSVSRGSGYSIVGRDGSVRELVLPLRARVVGQGRGVLYLAIPDQDDLERLERRAWR